MRVRDNWLSLLSWRSFSKAASGVEQSITRLSSGLRINAAADDSAGLGISERLRAQFRGLIQANRNAMDGMSLVQTAEGALNEVHELLQRGRELALQAANGVWDTDQKTNIQTEVSHLLYEIDRIADTTSFNGRTLLSDGNSALISGLVYGLRSGWLEEAAKLVEAYYGITGNDAPLRIVLESSGDEAAWITGASDPLAGGVLNNLTLHINIKQFQGFAGPDGGTPPVYNDRKIAQALTQAILGRNANFDFVDEWFVSGIGDFIAGRDEQLKEAIATHGAAALINTMLNAKTGGTWVDDSLHRSAAYLAVKFLHEQLQPGGLRLVMDELKANPISLNDAMMFTYFADADTFIDDFVGWGGAWMLGQIDLNDADVGGVGGGDAIGVIPNGVYREEPVAGFQIDWSSLFSGGLAGTDKMEFTLQVGANTGDTITFEIPTISAFTLQLMGINVVSKAEEAVGRFSAAIKTVSGARSQLGTVFNRLEYTIRNNAQATEAQQNSFSRIRDLDYAKEVANLTRHQILTSSSGAMLAQSNTTRQHVMWLLNGLSAPKMAKPSMAFGASLS